MTRVKRPRPYYDSSRPGSTGRWVAIVKKTSGAVQLSPCRTEFDACKAMGLRGGSKDPNYRGAS